MKHLKKRKNTELKWKVNETHCGLRFAMTCLNNKGLAGWWLHFYLLNCYNILTSPAGKLWRVEVIIALFSFAAFLFLCTLYILFSPEMSAKCNNLCGSWKGRFFFISGLLCNIFMYCYKTRHFFWKASISTAALLAFAAVKEVKRQSDSSNTVIFTIVSCSAFSLWQHKETWNVNKGAISLNSFCLE